MKKITTFIDAQYNIVGFEFTTIELIALFILGLSCLIIFNIVSPVVIRKIYHYRSSKDLAEYGENAVEDSDAIRKFYIDEITGEFNEKLLSKEWKTVNGMVEQGDFVSVKTRYNDEIRAYFIGIIQDKTKVNGQFLMFIEYKEYIRDDMGFVGAGPHLISIKNVYPDTLFRKKFHTPKSKR